MRKLKMFFVALTILVTTLANAQSIKVSGVITDANTGDAVPFAAIQVKGTMVGASSDANGEYSIAAPANATLVFSSIGYVTQEIAVDGKGQLSVQLAPDAQALEETIVVAYGTATKSAFTGSAAVVKAETIENHVASSVTSALAGTTPGVQITSASGDPTSNNINIRVRGFGSISASSAPLIVVDGAPYDGSLNDINPSDVESMSVLKDAAASAIYGARGANGVVLITTKKAKSGDAEVKFDAKWGSNSRLIPQYDVITDPGQYYETQFKKMYYGKYFAGATPDEAYAAANKNLYDAGNGGLGYQVFTVPEGENLIGTNFKLNPKATLGYYDGEYYYTPDDWYNETFHSSFRQEYNLSVGASREKFNFYASAGYLQDGGVVNNSKYQRYTARINADYQAKKWLKFTTSMNFSHSDSDTPSYGSTWGSSGNVFYITNNMGPIYPLYVRKIDENGNPYIVTEGGRTVYDANQTNFTRPGVVGNAVRDNENDVKKSYVDQLQGKWGVDITPVKGLTLTANIAAMSRNSRVNNLYSVFGSSAGDEGTAYVAHGRYFTVNNQYLANYKTDFGGSKHNLEALVGYEQYTLKYQELSGQNDHLFDPYIGELNNADGSDKKQVASYTTGYVTKGILARAQYDYDQRYFISGSFRRDASSRFAPGHQWGNFPSVGAAWVLSNERWLSGTHWIDLLKLKASYGSTGNDNLGSYFPYSDQYTHSYNASTGEYSTTLAYKGNENLTWETINSVNAGVEFGFWKGKLNGSIEWYQRDTKDLLYALDVPLSAGNPLGYIPTNVGSIRNMGVEIALDGNIIKTKNVSWDWNFNIAHNKNTVTDLDVTVREKGIPSTGRIIRVGGSLYESYLYRYAGLNEFGEPLFYEKVYVDGKWDGESVKKVTYLPTGKDQTSSDPLGLFDCGDVLPKVTGGLGMSFKAYGFDLSFQLSYQLGGKYYDGSYQALMQTNSSTGSAWHKDALNSWTPENQNTNIPRLDKMSVFAQSPIDYFLISSDYLSVNNVTVGYSFPAKLLRNFFIKGIRVYAAGENLAVASARKGVDPRYSYGIGGMTTGSGLNTNSYSAMRNITGGITLTF